MSEIYMDYAAATPMSPEVLDAMQPFFTEEFYNPSAVYLAGRRVRRQMDESRHRIASILGAKPAEIIFTAGATEANNLAINGIAQKFSGGQVLVSSIEHESVLEPAKQHKAGLIPVDDKGLIILNKLSNLINDSTVLISIMLVNNELGTVQPIGEISKIIALVRITRQKTGNQLPLYLHTDAAQAGNYLDLHTSRLGVDLMSLNGGKIYGPKQSGILYVKAGTQLAAQIVGGGQEFGLRSGTENVAAAAGFAKALELAQASRAEESGRITELRKAFETKLLENFPHAIVNSQVKHKAPHITSLTLPGTDNERLMMELDERGIQCAVGSACSASSDEPSHVLKAIGLDDALARSTLRFSLGTLTTQKDVAAAINALGEILKSNR